MPFRCLLMAKNIPSATIPIIDIGLTNFQRLTFWLTISQLYMITTPRILIISLRFLTPLATSLIFLRVLILLTSLKLQIWPKRVSTWQQSGKNPLDMIHVIALHLLHPHHITAPSQVHATKNGHAEKSKL